MTKAENLSKAKILSELKRYKQAYGIVMENFEYQRCTQALIYDNTPCHTKIHFGASP